MNVDNKLMNFYVGEYYWQIFDSRYELFFYNVSIRKDKFRRTK